MTGSAWSGEVDQQRTVLVPDQTRAELDELIARARRVRDEIRADGVRLTRRELATRIRAQGGTVSNDRAGELARALAAEATRLRAIEPRGPDGLRDADAASGNQLPKAA